MVVWGRVSDPSRPSGSPYKRSAAFGEGTGFSRAAKVLFVYSPSERPLARTNPSDALTFAIPNKAQ